MMDAMIGEGQVAPDFLRYLRLAIGTSNDLLLRIGHGIESLQSFKLVKSVLGNLAKFLFSIAHCVGHNNANYAPLNVNAAQ